MGRASAWCPYLVLVLAAAAAGTAESEEKAKTCVKPYVYVGGHCLFFYYLSQTTWDNARMECELFHGHLVKIDYGNKMERITDYINEHSNEWGDLHGFWVGATDVNGYWLWVDGMPVKMGTPFWGYLGVNPAHQEPDGGPTPPYCAVLPKSFFYYLHDYPCTSYSFSPLCEQQ